MPRIADPAWRPLVRLDFSCAREDEEVAARKVVLSHVDSVETQIRTKDALEAQRPQPQHVNSRSRDAADNILLDSTKPNRQRDALMKLLALFRHCIAVRNAYF